MKIRIPINVTKFGNVGYRFQKHFKGYGTYEGRVMEIRSNVKGNKDRRCIYSDGDIEDLSLKDIKKYNSLNFLTPVKKIENKPVKIRISVNKIKVGDIGYKFRKSFKGHGIFEGCVIEIKTHAENKKNRRCLYTDGDMEDLSIVQIRSYDRVTPRFLSPVNVFKNSKSSKKPDLSPVENKVLRVIMISTVIQPANRKMNPKIVVLFHL